MMLEFGGETRNVGDRGEGTMCGSFRGVNLKDKTASYVTSNRWVYCGIKELQSGTNKLWQNCGQLWVDTEASFLRKKGCWEGAYELTVHWKKLGVPGVVASCWQSCCPGRKKALFQE